MERRFTGRHMAIILASGFGVVIAVNLLMATLAVRGFGGVVVENSYVASQNFNDWLARADKQNALGWKTRIGRSAEGRLEVVTSAPAGTSVIAQIRRPVGDPAVATLSLVASGNERYVSETRLPEGRWLVRIDLEHGEDSMQIERPVG